MVFQAAAVLLASC